MNKPQAFLGSALLALSAALAGLAATPATVLAGGDHSYKPSYTPDYCHHCSEPYCPPSYHHDNCRPTYQAPAYCPPCYHYEYCNYEVKVPYTCSDECGRPYTSYKYETVQKRVKVSD